MTAKWETFTEDFSDASAFASHWLALWGGSPAIADDAVTLRRDGAYRIRASNAYDLASSSVTIEFGSITAIPSGVLPTGSPAIGYPRIFLQISNGSLGNVIVGVNVSGGWDQRDQGVNWLEMAVFKYGTGGSAEYWEKQIGGPTVYADATRPPIHYDPVQHKWWRISQDANLVLRFDTSPNGWAWTNRFTTSTTLPNIDASTLTLEVSAWSDSYSPSPPTIAVINGINVAPPTPGPGIVSTAFFGTPAVSGYDATHLQQVGTLGIDAADNLYVLENPFYTGGPASRIRRISPAAAEWTHFSDPTTWAHCGGFTVLSDGTIIARLWQSFPPQIATITTGGSASASYACPDNTVFGEILVGFDNSVFTTDGTGALKRRVGSSWAAFTTPDFAGLKFSGAVIYGGAALGGNIVLKRIEANSVITTIATITAADLGFTGSLQYRDVYYRNGNYYISGRATDAPDLEFIAQLDDVGISSVKASWPHSQGAAYSIVGDSHGNLFGAIAYGSNAYTIQKWAGVYASDVPPPPPGPVNDLRANATVVTIPTPGATFESLPTLNTYATADRSTGADDPTIEILPTIGHTVWWKYTPMSSGSVLAELSTDPPNLPGVVLQLWRVNGDGTLALSSLVRGFDQSPTVIDEVAWGVEANSLRYFCIGAYVTAPAGVTYTLRVSGPPTVVQEDPNADIPPFDPGEDHFTPTAPQVPTPATPAGYTTSTLIDLIRAFSTKIKRAVRITSVDSVPNPATPLTLPYASVSIINRSEKNRMQIRNPADIYSAASDERKAGEGHTSMLSGATVVDASAVLVNNDASILLSGWRIPGYLPLPAVNGAASGLAPVKSVRFTFTPDDFTGEIELYPGGL